MRDARRARRHNRHLQDAGRTRDNAFEFGNAVKLKPLHDAKAVAQRRGQQPGTGGCAHQRERWNIQFNGTRCGTFTDHDIELIVLHGRIQHFFNDRTQAMNLIDEQHIARL